MMFDHDILTTSVRPPTLISLEINSTTKYIFGSPGSWTWTQIWCWYLHLPPPGLAWLGLTLWTKSVLSLSPGAELSHGSLTSAGNWWRVSSEFALHCWTWTRWSEVQLNTLTLRGKIGLKIKMLQWKPCLEQCSGQAHNYQISESILIPP